MIFSFIWWLTGTDYGVLYICGPIDIWCWLIFFMIPFKLWLDGPPQARDETSITVQNNEGQHKEGGEFHFPWKTH
jgi:hypothetical protein